MEPSGAVVDIEAQQRAARERFERDYRAQQRKLRLQGAAIATIGLLLNAVNLLMVVSAGRYFVLTLAIGPAMLFVGICLAALGRPIDRATGRPAKWGNVALGAAIALGAIATITGLILLHAD
jgi:hypothetical protein